MLYIKEPQWLDTINQHGDPVAGEHVIALAKLKLLTILGDDGSEYTPVEDDLGSWSKVKRSAPDSSLSIIIADDNRDNAESIATLLQLWGHTTHVCRDPLAALGHYMKIMPDVMLLDIGFPLRSDGLKVARQAKQLDSQKSAIIIAVTGHSDDETRDLAKDAGFDHYFVKPVDLERLKQLLSEHRRA